VREERSEKVLWLSDARGGVESSLSSGEARGGVTTSQSSSSREVEDGSRRKREGRIEWRLDWVDTMEGAREDAEEAAVSRVRGGEVGDFVTVSALKLVVDAAEIDRYTFASDDCTKQRENEGLTS